MRNENRADVKAKEGYVTSQERREYPACEHCGREFAPGVFWPAANYCRTRYLLPVIEAYPGLSAAELSRETGLEYDTVSKALTKARGLGVVDYTAEDRGEIGGVRYRFTVKPGWRDIVSRWTV